MNWNKWVRQIHRWLAMAFTLAVIATIVALAQKEPAVWVSYLPLLPLALLQLTGLYLFVLPYATKWRSARRTHRTLETSAVGLVLRGNRGSETHEGKRV